MAWERFEAVYPKGTETKEYGFVTADQLRATPDIIGVTVLNIKQARKQTIKIESHMYGPNNEYALGVDYDVYDATGHPDEIYPLNVYGAAMLNDYLYLNKIIIDPGN